MKKFLKVLLITLGVLVVIAAIVFFARKNNRSKRVAEVFPMNYYAITDYNETIESFGSVMSDGAQAVYLPTDTRIIEVLVSEGDIVAPGDLLLTIDKADSSLTVEAKELEIKQAQLDLKISKARLAIAEKAKVTPDADKMIIEMKYDDDHGIMKEIYYDESMNWLGENTFEDGILIDEFNPEKGWTLEQKEDTIFDRSMVVANDDLRVRRLMAELDVLQDSSESGEIVTKTGGIVTKVCDAESIPDDGSAFLIVSDAEGYYVTGQVSELYLESVTPGTRVDVSNWETGYFTTATITEIDTYPSNNPNSYSNSNGNSNVTYYNYKAVIDDTTGMELGNSVNISLNLSMDSGVLYLYDPYIRTEDGRSYIMIMGENDKLEKIYVNTGSKLWGSYTKITTPIAQDGYIAFPYGPNAIEGAKCEIEDSMW